MSALGRPGHETGRGQGCQPEDQGSGPRAAAWVGPDELEVGGRTEGEDGVTGAPGGMSAAGEGPDPEGGLDVVEGAPEGGGGVDEMIERSRDWRHCRGTEEGRPPDDLE